MMEPVERRRRLKKLIKSLFSLEELNLFVLDYYGEEVTHAVNFGEGLDKVASEVVEVFGRRGLLDRKFFGNLQEARPGASKKISEVSGSTRLDTLYEERAKREVSGEPVEDITEEIKSIKRELRSGPELVEGDYLAGRYKLIEELGKGGFAKVWKVFDRETRTFAAAKILHGQYSKDRSRIECFFRGARVMARLDHPHVVRVLNPRVEDDGYSAFVMEFVEGGDLHRYLGRTFNRNAFLELMISVGEGVAACHAKGIIHRDLKPSNILLTSSEDPKISDFDLVKVADTTGGTRTGAMGTFVYAAPECMKKGKDADERADVFSLTMMCVAGLLNDIEELDLSFVYYPNRLNELPIKKPLQEFLARGTSLEPSERPGNASIWTEELRGLIKPKPPKKKSSELWVPGEDTQLSIGGVSFKMIWIEPGTFWMGSPDDDEEAYSDDEKPRHKVTLTEGFWMAETPCTQALWEAMTGKNPSEFKGAQNPVENVSWDDIQAVLWALNERQSNLGLRLPTEAEWEYACRAGTQTPRYGKLDEVAWYRGNRLHRGNSRGTTHPVGQKAPNPWGLYDTLGNVWEWCQDWHGL